jgi:hypothetical protein
MEPFRVIDEVRREWEIVVRAAALVVECVVRVVDFRKGRIVLSFLFKAVVMRLFAIPSLDE